MTEFLDLEDLLRLVDAAPVAVEVRDLGLLESALARPRATAFGEDAYASLDEKAAALLHNIVRNHALVDGNKRLGWTATRLFYARNGVRLEAPHDEAFDLVMRVAEGLEHDITKIAQSLARWH